MKIDCQCKHCNSLQQTAGPGNLSLAAIGKDEQSVRWDASQQNQHFRHHLARPAKREKQGKSIFITIPRSRESKGQMCATLGYKSCLASNRYVFTRNTNKTFLDKQCVTKQYKIDIYNF